MTKFANKWFLIRVCVVTVVACFLLTEISNGGGDINRGVAEREKAGRIGEGTLHREARATLARNSGNIKFVHKKRNSVRGPALRRTALVSERAVFRIVDELKQRLVLPFNIQVVFEDCGGPDSSYDKYAHEILICRELFDVYDDLFSQTLSAGAARDEAVEGAVVAMFLHEVAHALIDGWDLPITGREEDAADQFSTLWLINGKPDGIAAALNGARSFKLLADLEKGEDKDYSDAHSLDEQRYFNTICLVYGHRPERYEYLIRSGILPVRRAYDCVEDYARLNKSWQTILAPHLISQTANSTH